MPDSALRDAESQAEGAARAKIEATAPGGATDVGLTVTCTGGTDYSISCSGRGIDTVTGVDFPITASGTYDPATDTVTMDGGQVGGGP